MSASAERKGSREREPPTILRAGDSVRGRSLACPESATAARHLRVILFLAPPDQPALTASADAPCSGLTNRHHGRIDRHEESRRTDYAVVVDAFDVTPGTPPTILGLRTEETSTATTFTSGWTQGDTTKAWSGGTAAISASPAVPGARATFSFTGTSVSWIGLRGPQCGIARVFLDGAF